MKRPDPNLNGHSEAMVRRQPPGPRPTTEGPCPAVSARPASLPSSVLPFLSRYARVPPSYLESALNLSCILVLARPSRPRPAREKTSLLRSSCRGCA